MGEEREGRRLDDSGNVLDERLGELRRGNWQEYNMPALVGGNPERDETSVLR